MMNGPNTQPLVQNHRGKRWLKLLLVGFCVQAVGGLYLSTVAQVHLFSGMMILFHIVLGILIIFPFFVFSSVHLWVSRKALTPKALAGGLLLLASVLILAVTGLLLTFWGATTQNRWLLHLHLVSIPFCAGFYLLHASPGFHQAVVVKGSPRRVFSSKPVIAGLAGFLIAAVLLGLFIDRKNEAESYGAFSLVEETLNPLFSPSPSNTMSGHLLPAGSLSRPEYCGACHKDIYDQWQSSAHHFSSFNNPFYRKTTLYAADRKGLNTVKWCGGCHDPSLLFTGKMDKEIDLESEAANAGLTCLSCHAIERISNLRGNGNYRIGVPEQYPFAEAENVFLKKMNRFLIFSKPGPHKKAMLKPFHSTAEFCSVCHKVGIPEEVNDYRFLRGQNEYDNWHNSGVSGNSARSFYYPKESKTCFDCHMPLIESNDPAGAKRGGKIRSHRFLAANSALPFLKGDTGHLQKLEEFMKDKKITIDLFGIKKTGPNGRDVIAPLDRVQPSLKPGEEVLIEVVVRNKGVGHTFPGGTIDSNEVWVEFKAVDESGKILISSGGIDKEGYVDPSAHFYRAQMVDRHANLTNKRNVPIDTVATVYARVIPPGSADVVHYKFTLPDDIGQKITLIAKLHYRKFGRWYTNWVFAGQQDPATRDRYTRLVDESTYSFVGDNVPTLPIMTMAEAKVVLSVDKESSPLVTRPSLFPEDWERFNDYGIGLLLQGNVREAIDAFQKVVELNPGYADGFINLARAAIADGNLPSAEKYLVKALAIEKESPKARYFLALVYKGYGRYDEAIRECENVVKHYPNDRVVFNEMGRIRFLQGKYEQAIAEFQKTLEIDPEDVDAHYNLMRSYYGLNKTDEAKKQQTLYLKYKVDETAPAVAARYRLKHPNDNHEAQAIHLHE